MKKWILQVGIAIVLIGVFVFFTQKSETPKVNQLINKQEDNNKPTIYNLDQILNVFKKHQIKLTPNKEIDAESFALNNVKPKIYKINNDDKRNLFIYIFKTVNDRDKYAQQLDEYNQDVFSSKYFRIGYPTWNAIILDTVKKPISPADVSNINKIKIDKVVFKDLNNGKVRQYKGNAEHWKVTYTLKYYDHSFVDNKGMYIPDKYGIGQFNIHYKPVDYSHVQNLQIEYDVGSSGGGLSGENLNKGNILINVDNNADPSFLPTMTIKWNDQEETITFKDK